MDRIIGHVLKIADCGDFLIISFHRGYLNSSRDRHIPASLPVEENEKYRNFVHNMEHHIRLLTEAGVKVVLVKDTPLLPETSNLVKCIIYQGKGYDFCSVALDQDLHTRKRQSDAFDWLAAKFPGEVLVIDPLPVLYGNSDSFNPIDLNGVYRMFDRHHLTESEARKLTGLLNAGIR